MDKLEEDQSTEDKLKEEAPPSVRAPHLRGLKIPNLKYKPECTHRDSPLCHGLPRRTKGWQIHWLTDEAWREELP